MESKERTLENTEDKYQFFIRAEDRPFILESHDTHARNCMIELLKYYYPQYSADFIENCIDGFLQSEYFKELQK